LRYSLIRKKTAYFGTAATRKSDGTSPTADRIPALTALFISREGIMMKVKSTLAPGRKGTKQLTEQYGDQLVCVRYRYDEAKQKRYKTVELIVDEQDWTPDLEFPTYR
jgi:hypothetical protein